MDDLSERDRALALRRGVLAVSVLDDVQLFPGDDGIMLGESPDTAVPVPWRELNYAAGAAEPESDVGRRRLRDWLRLRSWFAELGPLAPWRAEQAAVPAGLPVGHALHPGGAWTVERVMGGVLDLGVGLRGLVGPDPDAVVLLPSRLARVVGLDTDPWWPALRSRLETMGELTVSRLERDGNGVILPMGGCDAVTLLGSRSLRRYLSRGDGTGMRAIAAPMRSRGWFDLARIDPAFVTAAAAATDEVDRGFWRPLLVTQDEVVLSMSGGNVTELVLRDRASDFGILRGER